MKNNNSLMGEIKIYHSVWRMLLCVIGCFLFAVLCLLILQNSRSINVFNYVIGWVGVIFFGLGGLALLYWLLKERLTGQPYLTITDEGIVYRGGWKEYEIRFADVHSFELLVGRRSKLIGIRYKEGVEHQKIVDAGFAGRLARKFNLAVSNTQEAISVSGVSINAKVLCDLLNEKLKHVK